MTDDDDDTRPWKRELRRADLPEELHQPYDALMIAHTELHTAHEVLHERQRLAERARHQYILWTGVLIGCTILNLVAAVAGTIAQALQ